MNIALFEDDGYRRLLPLTWLRPAFELRCGRDRLIDKVRSHVRGRLARTFVRAPLTDVVAERCPLEQAEPGADWCLLNARALVSGDIAPPPPGCAWRYNGELVACSVAAAELNQLTPAILRDPAALGEWATRLRPAPLPAVVRLLEYPWDLVLANAGELRRQCRNGGEHEGEIYPGAHLVHADQIHLGRGARIKPGAVLDAEDGPVYIERDVLIEANAVIQGPGYIGPGSIVRTGATLRPGTTVGPMCRVAGEISGCIFQGYANKQHEGYLGHSFVAEWVNIGAGTITSDLKNTYGTIRVSLNGVGVETGQCFIGSFIGDHSKTGIGTILPTGCVIGVASHVFATSAVPKFVPSFAWLTDAGMTECRVDKAVHIARTVMGRRDVTLSPAEQRLLEDVAGAARAVEAAGWR